MINNKFIRNYHPLLIVVVGFVLVLLMGFFVFKFTAEREERPVRAIPSPPSHNVTPPNISTDMGEIREPVSRGIFGEASPLVESVPILKEK